MALFWCNTNSIRSNVGLSVLNFSFNNRDIQSFSTKMISTNDVKTDHIVFCGDSCEHNSIIGNVDKQVSQSVFL